MKVSTTFEAKTTVDRSRFFAVLFPAASDADLGAMLKAKKGEHRKANHHCWAFRFRDAEGVLVEKSKDDGEVGHPGRILLELLKRDDLEGGLLVSRIFGGVKLGVGGVSRAFREAGEAVVAAVRPGKPPSGGA